LLTREQVGSAIVLVDGQPVGIVTDRDLRDAFPSVFEAKRNGHPRKTAADPATIQVGDVMTMNVLSMAPEDQVEDAARMMRAERIGALPIVADGRLVGILTRSDVLGAFLALTELEARPI